MLSGFRETQINSRVQADSQILFHMSLLRSFKRCISMSRLFGFDLKRRLLLLDIINCTRGYYFLLLLLYLFNVFYGEQLWCKGGIIWEIEKWKVSINENIAWQVAQTEKLFTNDVLKCGKNLTFLEFLRFFWTVFSKQKK